MERTAICTLSQVFVFCDGYLYFVTGNPKMIDNLRFYDNDSGISNCLTRSLSN